MEDGPLALRNEHVGIVYGTIYAMKTTIDAAGRLVIPKEIRREAGIKAGMPLEVRLRNGCIEIEPAPLKVRFERRGRFLVAVPEESVPLMTGEVVEATRRKLRRQRGVSE